MDFTLKYGEGTQRLSYPDEHILGVLEIGRAHV